MRRRPGRGPQSEKKGRHKRQKDGAFPFGLIASAAAPLLGEVAKPMVKKLFEDVEEKENTEEDEENNNTKETRYSETNYVT